MKIPTHLAIIMDGNGRWAKKRNLPRSFGHKAGAENIEMIIERCKLYNIKYLSLFVFSSENWNRSKEEVDELMRLLQVYLAHDIKKIIENNIKVIFIGDCQKLSSAIQGLIKEISLKSQYNSGLTLILAISYGGRDQIRLAANEMLIEYVKNFSKDFSVDINTLVNAPVTYFDQFIEKYQIPDPDLLIRTGGEYRISNFMLWQLAYTELYFSSKLWPDFAEGDLDNALNDFSKRDRRFGKE